MSIKESDIKIGCKVKSSIVSGEWEITKIKGKFITTQLLPRRQEVETRIDLFIREWELIN